MFMWMDNPPTFGANEKFSISRTQIERDSIPMQSELGDRWALVVAKVEVPFMVKAAALE